MIGINSNNTSRLKSFLASLKNETDTLSNSQQQQRIMADIQPAENDETAIIDAALNNDDCNILIHGPGGCGKSYIIKDIVSKITRNVAITAATGVAAINIGGTTLHRFFGVGLCKGTVDEICGRVHKNYQARKRIKQVDLLVIDEISMIGASFFDTLNCVAQHVRKSTLPFGGIRLVVSGDFLQLAPIGDQWIFTSETWKKCNFRVCHVTEPKRFTDVTFYNMLMRARTGNLTQTDIKSLVKCVERYNEYIKQNAASTAASTATGAATPLITVKPTILYSLKKEVNQINTQEMAKIKHPERTYRSVDSIVPLIQKHGSAAATATLDYYKPLLDDMAPEHLILKVGCQVMLTWNLDIANNLCNGTRGVVEELLDQTVFIRTLSGQHIAIERMSFTIDDKQASVTRNQFPLIVAFAMTIHRAQGSTLDFCIVDIGPDVFATGQAYVGLSRARNWEALLLSSFSSKSVKADKDALAYVNLIESQ